MNDDQDKTQLTDDQQVLLNFVDELLSVKKDPTMTEETMPQVRLTLLNEVNDSINAHLLNLLPEDAQIELDELLDQNVSDEELNGFFTRKIPDLETEIARALINFREAYLADVAITGVPLGGEEEGDIPMPPAPAPMAADSTEAAEQPMDTEQNNPEQGSATPVEPGEGHSEQAPTETPLDTTHELPADTQTEEQHEQSLPMVMTPNGPKVVN